MRGSTHLAVAGLTGVVAAGFGSAPGFDGAAALAVGALLPDIDTQHSGFGKFIRPVSGAIERRFGHRTITHSLLGVAILALGSSWLLLLNPNVWVWLIVGVLTHLVLDTANIVGVPLLWPHRLQFWMVHNRSWRVPYGSPREFSWLTAFSLTAVALVPLSMDGFSPWFHRAMGTTYGAVQDYMQWRDNYEVWVKVKGVNLLTREDVDQRYRVIDALGRDVLVVEDEAGRAYTVGLEGTNISSAKVTAWRGEPILSSNYRLDLGGRLVADLIQSLPRGARRVYVTAALELKGHDDAPPALGYFERIRRSGSSYDVRSATVGDLKALSHLAIDAGSAVIRAEYSPGSEALHDLDMHASLPAVQSHVLTIPNLPSVSGLVVAIGDRVGEGSLLARYVDDSMLEVTQAEMAAAQERIPELEEALELERQAHEARLEGIRDRLGSAQERLERTRYLVGKGAAPRADLTDAEASYRQAKQSEVAEGTAWTSKQAGFESQLKAARLTILKGEASNEANLERQWVRAPVAGLVSDIRLTGVTTQGVNIEMIILEQQPSDVVAER